MKDAVAKPGDIVVVVRRSPLYSGNERRRFYVVDQVDGKLVTEGKKHAPGPWAHPSHFRVVGSFDA